MANALVMFGSTTGNTESVAQMVAPVLAENGFKAQIKDVARAEPDDFGGRYDLIVFGCSTWGDDEIELQEDFAEFFENIDQYDFSGKKVAVFGCGDSTYEHFCGAVDAIEEKIKALGAELIISGLKIDGDPDDYKAEVVEWAENVASSI